MTLMRSQSPQKFWQEQTHHHNSEVVARRFSVEISQNSQKNRSAGQFLRSSNSDRYL